MIEDPSLASDGNPAMAFWEPHYPDPLDVLTWRLAEAFGAVISERQWLSARELLVQFEPTRIADEPLSQAEFEPK